MLEAFFALLWAWFVQPIVDFLSPRHAVKYSRPGRAAPNPLYFPFYFQNRDGLWIHWTEWRPAGLAENKNPVGIVFLVGGLAEHTARYDGLARRFTTKGFIVYSLDHQGQGLSEGERKYVERFSNYVDDLEDFIRLRLDTNRAQYEALPRFILGHSMGGLITAHLAMRHPTLFSGVILSAPALVPDPKKATPFLKKVAKALGEFVPKLGLDTLDARLVSRNKQIFEAYVQDPCVPTNLLRARWASEMLTAMDAVWKGIDRTTFPLLLLHGAEDGIVLIEGSERLAQEAKSKDKKFIVYPDAYHEFFTDEKCGEAAIADVFDFIDHRMVQAVPLPRRE